MKKKSTAGFTLVEILISMGILVFGVVGILALFPAGLKSTKAAVQESYAATIADSVYAALRASAKQVSPGEELVFFHDGISPDQTNFVLPKVGKSIGIPGPIRTEDNQIDTQDYNRGVQLGKQDFAVLGRDGNGFNIATSNDDETASLNQYSFNIQISYPRKVQGREQERPTGVFDVMIRISRGGKVIKRFPSKIFIPTDEPNEP